MTDFEHRHRLRVRYAETDAGRVAHHSSYVPWMEEARTEWMRARGRPYREVEDEEGIFLMVAEMSCRYRSPARYDDELEITVKMTDRRRVGFTLAYEIRAVADDRLIATGMTRHVATDRDGKVRPLPEGV